MKRDKVLLIWDSGKGKTSIVNKNILNKWTENYSPKIAP